MRVLICWFRGHVWRYDRHIWATGMEPLDQYVCESCGAFHLESLVTAPVEAAPEAAAVEAAA